MFNLGPMELVVILVLALLIFGPGKLPEVGQALGKSLNEFRRATRTASDPPATKPETPNRTEPAAGQPTQAPPSQDHHGSGSQSGPPAPQPAGEADPTESRGPAAGEGS